MNTPPPTQATPRATQPAHRAATLAFLILLLSTLWSECNPPRYAHHETVYLR